MNKLIALAVLLCTTSLVTTAQDNDNVFLMYNQNVVNFTDGGEFDALADASFIPVLKSLVADSMIIGWGFTDHAWGDEWNKNYWIVATDHAAFLAGWGEFISRVFDQYPEALPRLDKLVRRHRDDMYIIRDWNASGPAGALMVQSSIVPRSKLADWNAFMADKSQPVLEEMLQENLLISYGNLNHRWGSEWNVAFYLTAENVAGTMAAWREFASRMNDRHPGWFLEAASSIEAHKDNIYSIRVQG